MEWSKLGELLGSSLGAGLNTYGDISLQRKAQQQEFEQKKQMILEQEAMRQRTLQAKEQERARKAGVIGNLIKGRSVFQDQMMPNEMMEQMPPTDGMQPQQGMNQPGEMPSVDNMPPVGQMQPQGRQDQPRRLTLEEKVNEALAAGLDTNEINQIARTHEKEEANAIKREELNYKKQQDYLRAIERKQAQENAFRNKKDIEQLKGVNKIVAENYTNRPILKEKRDNYKSLVEIAKNPESLRIGSGRQLLDKFGLGKFWQSPLSDVADKLISRIIVNESQTTSGATANTIQGLKNIKESVPNLMQNPEAFEAIANALYYTSEAQYIESKELNKLAADGVEKDIISKRDKITKPMTKELHKRANYALSLASVPVPVDLSSAMKYMVPIKTLYTLPPIEEAPEGFVGVDNETGLEFPIRDGKYTVREKRGK